MGTKLNFVLSVVALVIAIVGCVLAVRIFFFWPAPLTEDRVSAIVEGKTRAYITEARVRQLLEEAIVALKPAVPEE